MPKLSEKEMYLGTVTVDGTVYAYASDPDLCGVFVGGRWYTQRWDTDSALTMHGDCDRMARNLVHIHKNKEIKNGTG